MRVAIAPSDQEAVFNYRLRWVAQALARAGEIELVAVEDELTVRHAVRRSGPPEAVGIKNLPDVDVLVIARVLAGRIADVIPMIQRQGIAVIVDIDDDFRHIPPGLATRDKISPTHTAGYNWRHAARACATADFVTCSTDALTRYAPHGRVAVLRNCVPKGYLNVRAQRDGKTIGWGGAVASHPGDLEVTHGGVGAAVRELGADFMVVGPGDRVQKLLDLPERPWATGPVEHYIYPIKVAEFDAGIAPLARNVYTDSKSHLKPLEYLGLGVPCVVSCTPEYNRLAKELVRGNGYSPCPLELAGPRAREWRRHLIRALRYPDDIKEERIAAGRQFVADHYVIEDNAWRWAECWEDAVNLRAVA